MEQQQGAAIPCWQHQPDEGSHKLSFSEVSCLCLSHHLPEKGKKNTRKNIDPRLGKSGVILAEDNRNILDENYINLS